MPSGRLEPSNLNRGRVDRRHQFHDVVDVINDLFPGDVRAACLLYGLLFISSIVLADAGFIVAHSFLRKSIAGHDSAGELYPAASL